MATTLNARRAQCGSAAGAIVGFVLCLMTAAPLSAAETFAVRLTPVPIDAQTRGQVTGRGEGAAELDGRKLAVTGSFSGLRAAATGAGLHEGAVKGVRGPQIAAIDVPAAASGSFSFDITLTARQLESLRAGRLYIQIHSESAPDGNLWGWLAL
jgi:CHRD domain